MAKILLLIAQDGFQTKEYHDPKRVLIEAGHTVVTASNEQKDAVSNIGENVPVDIALRDVRVSDYDAVYAIGGPGALQYLDNEETVRIMTDAMGKIPYGAICISPRILAKAGVLSGLRATGWDNDNELAGVFAKYGVHYEKKPVVTDGRVVTADGPRSAEEFGHAIASVLT